MARLIKIGGGGGEISWHEALKDLRADDVYLLEPGFYELPQGLTLADVTLKGMGSVPEETVILGYIRLASDSRFVNLENLCLNTNSDDNALFMPAEANGYLSLRNCTIKGPGTDTAAIAINGQATVELYSSKVTNGSLSIYANASYRLELNDSEIDYVSKKYCALALEGKGTAIINNSRIHGSTNTFARTNLELDINNSQLDYLVLHGEVWLNLLNSRLLSPQEACLFVSDSCWCNIVATTFRGGLYLEKKSRSILQNSQLDQLVVAGQAQVTLTNCQILAHADFQEHAVADAIRTTFCGNRRYQYFLALTGQARLTGQALILNTKRCHVVMRDQAVFKTSVLASDRPQLEIEVSQKPQVQIMGLPWTAKKK